MPRLLFLSHSSTWGGAEKCLALLLEKLPRDRYRPTVLMRGRPFCFQRPAGLEARCRLWGLDARRVDLKWWVRDWRHDAAFAHGLPRRVERITRIIEAERIDLVVTNTSTVVEGALAARQCGVPHVWHVLEMLSRDPVLEPFLPLSDFYDTLQSLARRIVVVSQSVKDEICQFAPSAAIEIVHTGLPPAAARADAPSKATLFGISDDDPVATFVGILSQRKGVVDLVEAARMVATAVPRARVVLVGRDGGQRAELQRRIAEHHLERNVLLLGHRRDVPDILARSDLFVLPALADPLPVAVLEAMSAGLPVVATRSGGCEEMIVDGQTGRLVAVGDPPALAAAMIELLADAALRQQMGRQAKQRFAAHFTQEAYVDAFCRVFDAVLAEAAEAPWPPQDIGPLVERLTHDALARRAAARREASLADRAAERMLTLAYRLGLIH